MKKLTEYIVASIVDHSDAVKIKSREENEETFISIFVSPEDRGKIIGKAGKIIKAIRQLGRVLAIKRKKKINIEIAED